MQPDHAFECGGRRMKGGLSQDRTPLPLVSVIVVAFQDREEVAALIENIAPYRGPDLELVIIDGGSDDGTLELLQDRNEVVDCWLSEPDGGVYEAMNKGIAAATGQYILHLNAGDRLLNIPSAELRQCLQERVDIACFRVQLDGGVIHVPRGVRSLLIENTWHHQGTFYRRQAHLGYDPTYRVYGDFDHNQRAAKTSKSIRTFSVIVSSHNNPGLSNSKAHFAEVYRCIRKNSGVTYVALAFLQFKMKGIRERFFRLLGSIQGWSK